MIQFHHEESKWEVPVQIRTDMRLSRRNRPARLVLKTNGPELGELKEYLTLLEELNNKTILSASRGKEIGDGNLLSCYC
jgi:hypothetical protein